MAVWSLPALSRSRSGGREAGAGAGWPGLCFTALPAVLWGWALGAQLFLVVQARVLAGGERRVEVGCVPEVG